MWSRRSGGGRSAGSREWQVSCLDSASRSGEYEAVHSAVRNDRPPSMVDRAFSLLFAFTPADPELSLAELCRRTGIAKPTAHRILGELTGWGIVERAGSGYRLGMGLFELCARAPAQPTLREAAAPRLAHLCA